MAIERVIPYSKQELDAADVQSVENVLHSDWITQGPKVNEFEQAIANYCGAKYAVAVSSGSAALHLAALAAGLNKNDEAITTPITFLATANCILYAGALPVFADIDFNTVNIDPIDVRKKITKKTKVILPVDFAGLPCALDEIKRLADHYGIVVIEDASHALGSSFNGHKVGSCIFSDMTIFSFQKIGTWLSEKTL